jgi:hypothetical protein
MSDKNIVDHETLNNYGIGNPLRWELILVEYRVAESDIIVPIVRRIVIEQ